MCYTELGQFEDHALFSQKKNLFFCLGKVSKTCCFLLTIHGLVVAIL